MHVALIRRLFLALALCLGVLPAKAAVTFDAKGTAACDVSSASSPVTLNCSTLTIGSSLSNSVLVVGVSYGRANNTTTLTATWNGTSMGSVVGFSYAPSAGMAIFCLPNPASGNHTLTIVMTVSGGGEIHAMGASFAGANQTTPCQNYNGVTNPASTATITVPVTSATGDLVVGVYENGSVAQGASNPNLSGTPLTTYGNDFNGPNNSFEMNYAPGAATVNLTDTGAGAAADWVGGGVDILAASGGGATLPPGMPMIWE